jgi:hypothetical protein
VLRILAEFTERKDMDVKILLKVALIAIKQTT